MVSYKINSVKLETKQKGKQEGEGRERKGRNGEREVTKGVKAVEECERERGKEE